VNDSEADTVTEHDQSYTTEDAADEVDLDFLYYTVLAEAVFIKVEAHILHQRDNVHVHQN